MNSKQKTEMGNPKKDGALKQAARWVAKMFDYKAENKYARGVWYVFATSVAALTLAINNYKCHRKDHDPTYLHDFSNQYVSPYIIYHDWYPS